MNPEERLDELIKSSDSLIDLKGKIKVDEGIMIFFKKDQGLTSISTIKLDFMNLMVLLININDTFEEHKEVMASNIGLSEFNILFKKIKEKIKNDKPEQNYFISRVINPEEYNLSKEVKDGTKNEKL